MSASRKPQIRTFRVNVDGYTSVLYSARSASKARAQAWRDFSDIYPVSFRDFLVRSSILRVADPPGVHRRVMVAGEPATTVIGQGHHVRYILDDSDTVLLAHPSEVSYLPEAAA